MLWPKKNSYKEFDDEKKFLQLENSPPPPPITFLMVRPLMSPLILSKLVPDRSLSRTTTLNDMGSGTAQDKRNTQLGGGKEIFILITFHIRTAVTIVSPRTNPNLVPRALPTHFTQNPKSSFRKAKFKKFFRRHIFKVHKIKLIKEPK